ncbi:MAG TPA: hypothetical protein VF041_18240 [Gemmatimonadaceae bacterium]
MSRHPSPLPRRATRATRAVARPIALAALVATLVACHGDAPSAPPPPPPPPPPPWVPEDPPPPSVVCSAEGEICKVALGTYDGSGQIVHPDIVLDRDGFAGHDFWLAYTPYPGGNANYENPSLRTDDSEPAWTLPQGGSDPLVPQPSSGHYSDPDITIDPGTHELRYYFRDTDGGRDAVLLMTSTDGVSWSTPREVTSAAGIAIVSPAVAREADGSWSMWSVNAVSGGCSTTATTIERRTSPDGVSWSAPVPVEMEQAGRVVWHIDVQRISSRGEYWAVFAAYPIGSGCAATDLFFARSTDGVHWTTYPSPVVSRADFEPFANAVYRSTFTYDPATDTIRLWLSGARYSSGWVWSAATVRYARATLDARVSATTTRFEAGANPGPAVWDPRGGGAGAANFP